MAIDLNADEDEDEDDDQPVELRVSPKFKTRPCLQHFFLQG